MSIEGGLSIQGETIRVARPHGDGGKVLLLSAVVLAIVGLSALGLAKLGVDRVPGMLSWKSDNVTVFVPIGLMLLVSIVWTIVLNVFLRR
jgi:hypothetical protein